ncbi:hypothetical protein INQ51_04875 [Maribellus sp. CM-23]|uniref:hypothetical protein n=1 Tax=Maribellus sp. CM-23 TaxID=2781026 RepID=UPI001F447350|nr:hypothetical protein [Maribellus sp. CM-23]MCE4563635.1 hypothetical protein [Maribellus sp. CM-23]
MKLKSLILFAVIFTLFSFKSDKTKLNGTWKLISMELVRNGQSRIAIQDQANGGQLKTWSDKYFMFVGKSTNGPQTINNYGGGTYDLSGHVYTEEVLYHNVPNFLGRKVQQYLEIKGDTLYQVYLFSPLDKDGNYDKNNCNIEKYVRVD